MLCPLICNLHPSKNGFLEHAVLFRLQVAKLDCTSAQSVCQEQDVKGYPTLAYFRNGKKVETYRGAR